jgi:DNA polymerase-3 subunit gamma/tau
VVFILATTELGKLPETIISRCQVFNFKKPTEQMLKDLVLDISESEGVKLDAPTADLIAVLGEGSFRDTTGVLQKVLNFAKGKRITREEVEDITGAPSTALINNFLSALGERDIEDGLSAIHQAAGQNIDMKMYLKLVLKKLRVVLLLKFAENMAKEFMEDMAEDDKKFLISFAGKHGANVSSTTLVTLLEAYSQIDYAFIPELPLELALVKLINGE